MFFDRPDSGELAILVHLELTRGGDPEDPREFEELVLSAGGDPVAFVTGKRAVPTAKYFIGSGKLDEIKDLVQLHEAQLDGQALRHAALAAARRTIQGDHHSGRRSKARVEA